MLVRELQDGADIDQVLLVREVEARQKREDARSALSDTERADTTAYTAALKAGWTADELKRVGLDAPSKRAPGRPRGNRRGAAASTSTAPTSTSDDTAAG